MNNIYHYEHILHLDNSGICIFLLDLSRTLSFLYNLCLQDFLSYSYYIVYGSYYRVFLNVYKENQCIHSNIQFHFSKVFYRIFLSMNNFYRWEYTQCICFFFVFLLKYIRSNQGKSCSSFHREQLTLWRNHSLSYKSNYFFFIGTWIVVDSIISPLTIFGFFEHTSKLGPSHSKPFSFIQSLIF